MVLIKVQYDAYNRHFKLLDRESAHALDDGENYLLIADLSIEDLRLTDAVQIPAGAEHVSTEMALAGGADDRE
jgi:hypothetical protein